MRNVGSFDDRRSWRPERGSDKAHRGLGTTVIEALAKRLDAGLQVVTNPPGTTVSIVHAASAWQLAFSA